MSAAHVSTRSIKGLAFVLIGPVIWAAHFFALYAIEGFLCGSGSWAEVGAVRPISVALTGVAVVALCIVASWQVLLRTKGAPSSGAHVYQEISVGLAVITLLAVMWSALPVILLPACTPAV